MYRDVYFGNDVLEVQMLAYLMANYKSLVNGAKQKINICNILVAIINGAPWLAHSLLLIVVCHCVN